MEVTPRCVCVGWWGGVGVLSYERNGAPHDTRVSGMCSERSPVCVCDVAVPVLTLLFHKEAGDALPALAAWTLLWHWLRAGAPPAPAIRVPADRGVRLYILTPSNLRFLAFKRPLLGARPSTSPAFP